MTIIFNLIYALMVNFILPVFAMFCAVYCILYFGLSIYDKISEAKFFINKKTNCYRMQYITAEDEQIRKDIIAHYTPITSVFVMMLVPSMVVMLWSINTLGRAI